MSQYTPGTRAWVGTIVLAAVALTILHLQSVTATSADLMVLGLLTLCAALAHFYPVRSASDGAVYPMTNVFIIAGVVLLPAGLVSLLPVIALTPDAWRHRRNAGVLIRWLFNVAQTALAAFMASSLVGWAGVRELHDLRDLVVVLGAAALFIVTQCVLVGVAIALNSRIPFSRTGTFGVTALMGEALKGVLAIAVAGLWRAEPVLLILVPAVLITVHRLTRTAHLAHLAEVDAKTGLHNSQHFERALEEEVAHSLRVGRSVAVLFVDLDHFKQVNDRHGHAAGDRVLRDVAFVIAGTLRKSDVVARFGGEEFVALLPGTDAEEAIYLADRVRIAIESHQFELDDGTTLRCTASIGVAVCPEDSEVAASLIKQADTAMYRAKQTRNAVAPAKSLVAAAEPSAALRSEQVRPAALGASAPASRAAALLAWGTIISGTLVAGASLWAMQQAGEWAALLPFMALAVAAEFLEVQVYEASREKMAFSFTIVVTMAAIAAQPLGAPLVSLTAATFAIIVVLRQRHLDKALFNLANPTFAAGAASAVYLWLRPADAEFAASHLAAAVAAVLTFVVLNFGVVSVLISMHSSRSLRGVIRESVWYAPIKIFLGLTGMFVGGAHEQLGLIGALIFAVPVLLMRFTLAFYAKRSHRTIDTLQALNRQLTTEIGQRQILEGQLRHRAFHDPATNLPNRAFFLEHLGEVLSSMSGRDSLVAVLYIDLKRFKVINDSLGHAVGDQLLLTVGQRLQASVRPHDMAAHFGGDQFCILLRDIGGLPDALVTADRVIANLGEPISLAGRDVMVSVTIGIALSTSTEDGAADLVRHAKVAMHEAKARPTAPYEVFGPGMTARVWQRLQVETDLRRAIEAGELRVHYQPVVSLDNFSITEVEALVRWQHPEHGLLSPAEFIPVAEETGLIVPIERWLLAEACRQVGVWQLQNPSAPLVLNVNLSPRQFWEAEDLVATTARVLEETGFPPHRLKLEVTESLAMQDPEMAISTLWLLKGLGIQLAIDDFGTGYSSLSYLERFPVDTLKIDRSFVEGLGYSPHAGAIARTTITLAKALGLTVTAEGIAIVDQVAQLQALGCDQGQGYYFATPLPGNAVGALLALGRLPAEEYAPTQLATAA